MEDEEVGQVHAEAEPRPEGRARLRFGICFGCGSWVQGIRVRGLGFMVLGFKVQGQGFGV